MLYPRPTSSPGNLGPLGSVLTRGGFRTLVLTSGIRSGALTLYPRPTSSPGNLGPLGSVLTRGELRTLLSPGAPRVRTPHSLVARSSKGSDSALSCRQELQGFELRTLLSPGAPRVRTPHSLVARSSKGSDCALSCRQELQGFGLRTQATAEDGSSHQTQPAKRLTHPDSSETVLIPGMSPQKGCRPT